jgi:predicted amidophosphoribosyltransferase
MALIKCKECQKEMSSSAKLCPHCGFKKPDVLWEVCKMISSIAAVILVIFFLLALFH